MFAVTEKASSIIKNFLKKQIIMAYNIPFKEKENV